MFKKVLLFSFFIITGLFPVFAFGASIYLLEEFSAKSEMVSHRGDEVMVSVYLSSDAQPVNAVEGELLLPLDAINIQSISLGNSVITHWVEPPAFEGDSIRFAGIIPGGFKSVTDPVSSKLKDGLLFSILGYLTDKEANFELKNIRVLAHDGIGSEIQINTRTLTLAPREDIDLARPYSSLIDDFNPPIFSDSYLMAVPESGKDGKLLVFRAVDSVSGVSFYELKVGGGEWTEVTSPVFVSSSDIESGIAIRATDWAGNSVEKNITGGPTDKDAVLPVNKQVSLGLIVLIVLGLLIVVVIYCRVRKR